MFSPCSYWSRAFVSLVQCQDVRSLLLLFVIFGKSPQTDANSYDKSITASDADFGGNQPVGSAQARGQSLRRRRPSHLSNDMAWILELPPLWESTSQNCLHKPHVKDSRSLWKLWNQQFVEPRNHDNLISLKFGGDPLGTSAPTAGPACSLPCALVQAGHWVCLGH